MMCVSQPGSEQQVVNDNLSQLTMGGSSTEQAQSFRGEAKNNVQQEVSGSKMRMMSKVACILQWLVALLAPVIAEAQMFLAEAKTTVKRGVSGSKMLIMPKKRKSCGLRWLLALLAPVMVAAQGVNEWQEASPSGTSPGIREKSSAVWSAGAKRMYFFGGYYSGSALDDLNYYDAQANAWVSVTPSSGTAPSARCCLTAVWDAANSKMWIFGGYDASGSASGYKNDLHSYDEGANAWVSVTPSSGTAPSARYSHSAVWDAANSKMWIFGGYDGGYKNDLHSYDTEAGDWATATPTGSAPAGRNSHTAVWSDEDGKMWIFGGYSSAYLNDLHCYNLQANEWTSVTPSGSPPTARRGHTAVLSATDGKMWIFGGSDGANYLDDLHYYDLQGNSWNAVSPTGTAPAAREYRIMVLNADDARIYIHAGNGIAVDLHYYDFQESTTTSSLTTTSSTTASATTTLTTSMSSTSSTTGTSTSSSTSSTTTSSSTTSSTTTSSTSTSSSTSSITTCSATSSTSTSASSSSTTTTSTSTSSSTTSSRTTSSISTSSILTSTSSSTASSSSTNTTTTSSATTSSATTSSATTTSSTTSSTRRTSASATSTGTTTASTSSTSITITTKTASATTTSTFTATKTKTAFPESLAPKELEELETKRKEAATQAVAAVEEAEEKAVAEVLDALLAGNSNATTPGVLGEASIETPVGPVKVAALSLEALAEADGPATISAGEETGAALQITAAVLGEVAKAAGSDTVLLSLAALSEDASSALKTGNVLAEPPPGPRRLAKSASVLQSAPISINFRTTNGTKIKVSGLVEPMEMVLRVANPNSTCAFWDEDRAEWSSEGVETIPHQEPGTIICRTTHLSIFGGVIDVVLRNVVLALECSTVSSLMNPDALRKIAEPEWLERPAALVMIGTFAVSLIALAVAVRADRRLLESFPAADREHLLMCVKVPEGQPQDAEEPVGEDEGRKGGNGAEEDEQKDPREETPGGAERAHEGDEEKKETAAGGDFELPSIFRTVRGLVEQLLDTVNQMTGGEGFIEELKEVVSNAEAGSINRAIGLVHAHRSGADQSTIQALQDRAEMADDNGRQSQPSRENVEDAVGGAEMERGSRRQADFTDGDASDEVAGGVHRRSRPSVHTIDVQSVKSEDFDESNRRSARNDGGRPRSLRESVVGMIGGAVAAARRGGSEMLQKVRALRGHVTQSGSGAAERYLNSNVFCRTLILFPAAHGWVKVGQMSISVSYSARVVLIYLKIQSAGMLNAMFFAATSLTPEADPGCSPDAGSPEAWIQKITVGIVSAMIGDFIIFLLFMLVRKSAYEEVEWTEEKKNIRRRKWKRREYIFWTLSVVYGSFLLVYTYSFLANVSEADAAKWLESTAISLLQDLLLKPILLAVILAVMSTIILNCRPSIKRKIRERWIEAGDDANPQEKLDIERPAQRSERTDTEFAGILPGAVPDTPNP